MFTKITSVDTGKMKDQDESHIKRWREMNLIRTAGETMTERAEEWKNRVKRIEEVQVDQIKSLRQVIQNLGENDSGGKLMAEVVEEIEKNTGVKKKLAK